MVNLVWPWALALLPLPIFISAWYSRDAFPDTDDAIKVTPRVRKAMDNVESPVAKTQFSRLLLLWLIWLVLLLAIAQPTLPGKAEAQPASGRTLTMAIDLSASMERKDFSIDEVAVDRLSVVKQIAGDFIESRTGDRIGLVLFGEEAFLGSPPSYDLESIRQELDNSGIGMAGRTTAIGDALGLAIQSLQHDPAPEKAIILLSDGTNNSGTAEPESAAKLADKLSIRIHAIGLGSEAAGDEVNQFRYTSAAADLDESTLKAIAKASGGQFFRARSTNELNTIYQEIDKLEGGNVVAPPVVVHQDIRNLFIIALLLLLLLQVVLFIRDRRFT